MYVVMLATVRVCRAEDFSVHFSSTIVGTPGLNSGHQACGERVFTYWVLNSKTKSKTLSNYDTKYEQINGIKSSTV